METYFNDCELEKENCKSSAILTKIYDGECKSRFTFKKKSDTQVHIVH